MIVQDLKILYEDNHIIAVNKPAGMLVQGDKTGDETLGDIVKQYIKEKYEKPGEVFLGVVHRIDRCSTICPHYQGTTAAQ
jgi:23S rRNA pseudouridine1911/1915/1917 synthase